ncbi:similar to An14g01720 [Aspergillus tubingensis]|uniref:similar to An14g01720 n=1 Tax=Aspergillus tubingensis TaxID=5068 RepID=UPI001578DE50|nr:similar to An14g01720 [Aspergillus tubingensis]GFN10950.1 similar to An14g01720 [Aspergillus tubingensis]
MLNHKLQSAVSDLRRMHTPDPYLLFYVLTLYCELNPHAFKRGRRKRYKIVFNSCSDLLFFSSSILKQAILPSSIHPSFARSIHIPSLGILIYSVKMQFTLITAFATAFLASFVAANPAPAPAPFEIGIGANAAANAAAEVAANAGLGAGAGIHFKA